MRSVRYVEQGFMEGVHYSAVQEGKARLRTSRVSAPRGLRLTGVSKRLIPRPSEAQEGLRAEVPGRESVCVCVSV